MDKSELASTVTATARLSGQFKLRSGQVSDTYFDKYRFESNPKLLSAIADLMVPLIPPEGQILAGLELGGIPLATALSLKTGMPAAYVRKQRKTYGTCKIAEGADLEGKNIVIVEDIITTGGALIDAVSHLHQDGAIVTTVLCAILRSTEPPKELSDLGLSVAPVFKLTDL
jgi:orotate phosphoribosyltransferase